MKYYKSKISKFLNGKGFYLVMALCMIAVGFAAYSAMDAAKIKNPEETEQSEIRNEDIQNEIIVPEIKNDSEQTDTQNSLDPISPTDTKIQAEYFLTPLKDGSVAKGFDNNTLQYSATYNDFRLHTGVDLFAFNSTTVASCGAGTVAAIDTDTSLGTVITIDHGNDIFIRYCGLKNIKVSVGDILNAGDTLGEIGEIKSEIADEAHLHLEVIKNGEHIDPTAIIQF